LVSFWCDLISAAETFSELSAFLHVLLRLSYTYEYSLSKISNSAVPTWVVSLRSHLLITTTRPCTKANFSYFNRLFFWRVATINFSKHNSDGLK
jgi:hypothetical protein